MKWISHAYDRLCMDLPEANSTTVHHLYCPVWAPCSCLSWSAVAMRASSSLLGFTPTRQRAGHIAYTKGLHEIFKYAHLKFTVYGRKHTYIHTTSANAVTLVWGSLRLVPINAMQLMPHYHDLRFLYQGAQELNGAWSWLDKVLHWNCNHLAGSGNETMVVWSHLEV